MTTLYNCKHSGDQFRITKFDSDWNPEASYVLDATTCECPAGHRPTCRHRQMLPKFIQREHIGDNWFLDFDRGGWVQGWKEEPYQITKQDIEDAEEYIDRNPSLANATLPEPSPSPSKPHSPTVTTTDFESVDSGSIPLVAAKGIIRRRV